MRKASGLFSAILISLGFHGAFAQPQLVRVWGTGGSGPGQFSQPDGIAVGPHGDVYVADLNNQRVQKFDSDGHFELQWLDTGHFPWALGVDSQDQVFVLDETIGQVTMLTGQLVPVRSWGNHNKGVDIAVGPNDHVYIGESVTSPPYGFSQVQEFTNDGQLVRTFGSYGTSPGQIDVLLRLAVAPDGSIWVHDLQPRLLHFSALGSYLGQWTGSFSAGAVSVASDGHFLLSDLTSQTAQIYSAAGTLLFSFGHFPMSHGVAASTNGTIYVTDENANQVSEYVLAPAAVTATSWSAVKLRYAGMNPTQKP